MKTVFYHRKLNKDNKLTKTIYENYLRSTMPCSFPCCSSYTHTSKTSKYEHYIIPTKKALTMYLPLFSDKNINTIILSSTLEQIRIDNLNEYKKVTEAVKNKFVFYNNFFVETFVAQMHCRNTYIERISNNFENILSDYEDGFEMRCVERTIQYYEKHVGKNIIVVTPHNVHLLPDLYSNENIIRDLIVTSLKEKTTYDEYYNDEKLNTLCQQGSVFRGVLYINAHNCFSGIVHAEYKGKKIRIKINGREDSNRALNLDSVYVEIKSEAESENFKSIDSGIESEQSISKSADECENNETLQTRNSDLSKTSSLNTDNLNETEVFGKVVGIYRRNYTSVIGTLDKKSINGTGPQFVLVIPLDKKIPKIRIRTSQIDEIENKRIMVRINEWERDSYYPFGSYVKCIGAVGDEKTEIESILYSNGIDYLNYEETFAIEDVIENMKRKIENYSAYNTKNLNIDEKIHYINKQQNTDEIINRSDNENVDNSLNTKHELYEEKRANSLQQELEDVYNQVLKYETQTRVDIRDIDVLSIDPPGCTDIDDALHCRKVGNLIEVGIHIADVSYFVEKDSVLDNEALKRGTTVYFTDRRFDMLPNYLSSNLCSLIADKDRLAFSVFIYFDEDFELKNTIFKKSVIRSKRSFTYEQAQNEMDGGKYKEDITMLNNIAKVLKRKRVAAGALDLSTGEIQIHAKLKSNRRDNLRENNIKILHENNGCEDINELPEIEKIEQKTQHETHSLVEEFMLIANILVANEIYAHHKDSAMLRRHPKFADDSFDELKEYLYRKNIDLKYCTSKELNDSITKIEDKQFKDLIKKIITRSMNQAVYFSSGSVPYDDFLHYGLAASIYTHFTSPIRRYADLIVHRQLEYVILKKNDLYDNEKIEEICKVINFRKRNAMYANLDCQKLFIYLYLKGKVLEEKGFIVRMRNSGVVVYIPSLGIEEIVYLDYDFDEINNCFLRNGSKIFELYEYVNVRIQENDEKFFIDRHFDIEIIEKLK